MIVTKYGNRKLYCAKRRSYVTHEDLASSVRAGKRVRVIDHKTKNDITVSVLLSVLYQQALQAKDITYEMLSDIMMMGL